MITKEQTNNITLDDYLANILKDLQNDIVHLRGDIRELYDSRNQFKIELEKLQATSFSKQEKEEFVILKNKYLKNLGGGETIYDRAMTIITVLDGNGAPENGLINRLLRLEDNYNKKVVEIDKRITTLESIENFKNHTQKQNKEVKNEWNTIISIILGIITLLTFVHKLFK